MPPIVVIDSPGGQGARELHPTPRLKVRLLLPTHDDDPDDMALQARLNRLSTSLDRRDVAPPKPAAAAGDPGMGNAMGAGFRVVTELVAGVIVGGGLGWLLDRLFHTKPLMMILLGSLGLLGGFWNVIRGAMLPGGGKHLGKE